MTIDYLKNIVDICPKEEALLGLDVGKKTIGLALADPTHSIATPLLTINRTKFTKDMITLTQIAKEYEVGGYVIGLPVNMNGTEGRRAQSIKDFAAEMQRFISDELGEPWIAFWDERLSTVSADNIVDTLVEKRKTKTNAKASGLIDKLAAQAILQGALDYLSN
ncbi:MAG: Holliday junction resolvase RuvX [Alphaproteobacteria bacterium]|nr:Holliday junction resolvase RuvX [Alphaproteobacteria bacterium]